MQSAYLEAVAQARDRRDATGQIADEADAAFRAALVRAAEHHSLRQIAPYAGISYSGVAWLIKQEARDDEPN